MHSHRLKVDIPTLQAETDGLLGQIGGLIGRLGHGTPARYERYGQQVAYQQALVQRLELRMTIIAPMKAGKSTIINSIVGQELLPSHSAAMTTLPTELVLKAGLSEPVLLINPQLFAEFQGLLHHLQEQIQAQGMAWAEQETASYPHLQGLLRELGAGFALGQKTTGTHAVAERLTGLNHVLRLARLLSPAHACLSLTTLPRIETSFWQDSSNMQWPEQNNLVIVDTPGPNEAGEHNLKDIVAKQIEQSSLVLIVLDFTQLKNEAAEQIKQTVQQVINLRGIDSLYVLVNKVDQRGRHAMSKEEVRQFVAADLGVTNPEHVFELSALWAFTAANFLRDIEQQPEVDISELESAQTLAEHTLGRRWQSKLASICKEELQAEARYLWRDSGFPTFLNRALNTLVSEAPHRALRTALQTSQNCLRDIRQEIPLRNAKWQSIWAEFERQVRNY